MAFDPSAVMADKSKQANSAAITVAVRNSIQEGKKVAAGKFIGVIEGKVIASADSLSVALMSAVQKILTPGSELVILYYGTEVEQN